jgi:8-oxo-dGTP pyrophosphatase MutT (NUDIX family)
VTELVHPAATVLVLRDTTGGIEVFMVRRHHAAAFMGGAYVFPGGRVDAADRSADASWCDGVPEAECRLPEEAATDALAVQVAAARELFEEAGMLLARDRDGVFLPLTSAGDRRRFQAHRADLLANRRQFREMVEGERLRLALDAFVLFAHWVTPPIDIRRFDTWFFATGMPPHQAAAHDGEESTASGWIRPADALSSAIGGDILLAPPTWATLRELERFSSVDAALAWARVRRVDRREPVLDESGGVSRLVLPGDPLVPEPDPVAFETRFALNAGRWLPE